MSANLTTSGSIHPPRLRTVVLGCLAAWLALLSGLTLFRDLEHHRIFPGIGASPVVERGVLPMVESQVLWWQHYYRYRLPWLGGMVVAVIEMVVLAGEPWGRRRYPLVLLLDAFTLLYLVVPSIVIGLGMHVMEAVSLLPFSIPFYATVSSILMTRDVIKTRPSN